MMKKIIDSLCMQVDELLRMYSSLNKHNTATNARMHANT